MPAHNTIGSIRKCVLELDELQLLSIEIEIIAVVIVIVEIIVEIMVKKVKI